MIFGKLEATKGVIGLTLLFGSVLSGDPQGSISKAYCHDGVPTDRPRLGRTIGKDHRAGPTSACFPGRRTSFLAIRKICAILLLKSRLIFAKRFIFELSSGKGIPGSVLGQNPGRLPHNRRWEQNV